MAVDGNDGFVDIRYAVEQFTDNAAELVRGGVTDGIRNIDSRGTGVNRGFDNAA